MSLSGDRIWHYFSMKPYTEMTTTTFVLDKNRTEKKKISPLKLYDINFENQIAFLTPKTFFLKILYHMKLGRLKKLFTKSTHRKSKRNQGGEVTGGRKSKKIGFGPPVSSPP